MKNIFLDRYSELLGKAVDDAKIPLPVTIRVNTSIISDADLLKRLGSEGAILEKIPFLQHGYVVKSSRFSLGAAPEYLQGYYYTQEAAAQVSAEVLGPKETDFVLDMCASPGGKTTQLAAIMNNKGTIIAFDIKNRLDALKNNLERMSVSNTIVYNKDAAAVSDLSLMFDKILLDAPCSGNFVNDPDWFSKRSIEQFKDRAKLQKSLLKAGLDVLKPSGVLVYSTCSLEPEENEEVIDWALSNFDIRLEPIPLPPGTPGLTNVFGKPLNPQVKNCLRFWPHLTGTQGFFVARIVKN